MSRKTLVLVGMTIGSLIGSYLPTLFGAGLLSYSSIFGSAIGGILGIVITYQLTR